MCIRDRVLIPRLTHFQYSVEAHILENGVCKYPTDYCFSCKFICPEGSFTPGESYCDSIDFEVVDPESGGASPLFRFLKKVKFEGGRLTLVQKDS